MLKKYDDAMLAKRLMRDEVIQDMRTLADELERTPPSQITKGIARAVQMSLKAFGLKIVEVSRPVSFGK